MDETVHYLLMASHLRLQKQLLGRLKGTGLTLGQPKVLDYLRDHNGASQKAIAQACHMEPGSLSVILTRMEGRASSAARPRRGTGAPCTSSSPPGDPSDGAGHPGLSGPGRPSLPRPSPQPSGLLSSRPCKRSMTTWERRPLPL